MNRRYWIDETPEEFLEEIEEFLSQRPWQRLHSIRAKGVIRRNSIIYPRGTTNLSLKFWKTVNDLHNS
jgi:hypothetical protein